MMQKIFSSIAKRLRGLGFAPTLVYSLLWGAMLLVAMSVARLVFLRWFSQGAQELSASTAAQALFLGLRYDLRIAILATVPLLAVTIIPWLGKRVGLFALPKFWLVYGALVWALLGVIYIFDFGHYSYLNLRLNASIINFAEDTATSRGMLWQTYPVLRVLLCYMLFIALMVSLLAKCLQACVALKPLHGAWWKKGALGVLAFLPLLFGVHGKFSQYPLRWSDAFTFGNPFAAAVALNPVQNFVDTNTFKEAAYDEKVLRDHYALMANYLGVTQPDAKTFNFRRDVAPKPNALAGQPNVVLVLLESFSGYKTSVFDNALNPTPNFAQIARDGVLFTHFFTAHFGTARGVFATVTGIPDVSLANTTSRNPLAVDQHTIINEFKGYEKYYFMGGSTAWANVRGVLKNNITGLTIYEEDSFTSPHNDVWGISDKNLFLETNKILGAQNKPFFAMIQTAGNHRPYTIPAEDKDFILQTPDDATLKANGFFAVDEFNSFRYMDYCIGKFIEAAKQEKYFDNTVFVFLGDHGITGVAGNNMPRAWTDLRLSTGHTPLLIYAPKLLPAARYGQPAQQVDVLPTIAGLFNFSYVNKTLGRDLLDEKFDDRRHSFTIYHTEGPLIGVVDKEHYLTMQGNGQAAQLFDIHSPTPLTPVQNQHPEKFSQMQKLTRGIYETARYMLTHNGKDMTQ